jgi:Domain of unknown function (DUF4279)
VPITRTSATLRIIKRDDRASAASITESLGIVPTRSHDAGDPRSKRNPKPWPHAMWGLESDLPKERALHEHLSQLCDAVEPKASALRDLAAHGYELDWFCFIDIQNGQGGVAIDPEILRRLAALPVVLSLDVYASDEDEE